MARQINTSILAAWAVVRWGVPYALLSNMARLAGDAGMPDAALRAASAAEEAPGKRASSSDQRQHVL
jgi:hypothetical protein